MSTVTAKEQEIIEDFDLFSEWDEKYQYIIELGQKLKPLNAEFKTEEYRIKGCQSSVWIHATEKENKVYFEADSDSVFVKGIIALLIHVLSGETPQTIIEADLGFIDAIGLKQHLAQTRANGLASMIKQMKIYALAFSAKQTNHTA
jgi:cysteine desulfuration protein SufE